MSVGVCIINRNGIALAADSAGTFTGNKMFYNTMDKVFSLSNENAYGAITYGNTAIYHVSIDQILKEFALYLSDNNIQNFFDILSVFADFIKEKNKYYKFIEGEKELCHNLIKDLVVEWGNRIKKIIGEEDTKQKINSVLEEFKSYIDSCLKIENYNVSKYIHNNYFSFFEEILNLVVPELKNFKEEKECFWDLISQYFNLSLQRETRNKSGVFFAGYGQNDAFPKFIHIEIYAVVDGKLKFSLMEKFEESSSGAQIVPLAQREVIMTFCEGISEYFINYIPQKVDEIILKKVATLQSNFSQEQLESIKECFKDCKQEIFDIIQASARDKNINPLLSSVQLIPLPEMAILAENLVNITSLKRTFALDGNQQTVGGPTDVAVISKAEGFIWVKKKTI